MMRAALLLLLVSSVAAADSLDDDLASLRPIGAHPVRVTFLGWRDHAIAYRFLRCDNDDGGGRSPYCDVFLCKASTAGVDEDCTTLLTLDFDLDESSRRTVDAKAVHADQAAYLAKLGPLLPGKSLPASAMKLPPPPRDQHARKIAVTVGSPDGACTAVVGTYRQDGVYEGVHYTIPTALARVECKP